MNLSKALSDLNPSLRARLHNVAALAGLTELQALELIMEASGPSVDAHLQSMPHQGHDKT